MVRLDLSSRSQIQTLIFYALGVTALPPSSMGYVHLTENPLYLLNGKMYKIPSGNHDHTQFRVQDDEGNIIQCSEFWPSGHLWYNRRDDIWEIEQYISSKEGAGESAT